MPSRSLASLICSSHWRILAGHVSLLCGWNCSRTMLSSWEWWCDVSAPLRYPPAHHPSHWIPVHTIVWYVEQNTITMCCNRFLHMHLKTYGLYISHVVCIIHLSYWAGAYATKVNKQNQKKILYLCVIIWCFTSLTLFTLFTFLLQFCHSSTLDWLQITVLLGWWTLQEGDIFFGETIYF